MSSSIGLPFCIQRHSVSAAVDAVDRPVDLHHDTTLRLHTPINTYLGASNLEEVCQVGFTVEWNLTMNY